MAIDPFLTKDLKPGQPEPSRPQYGRYQTGALLSGPIVPNRVFGLVTYEGNYQDRANQVALGNTSRGEPRAVRGVPGQLHEARSASTWGSPS